MDPKYFTENRDPTCCLTTVSSRKCSLKWYIANFWDIRQGIGEYVTSVDFNDNTTEKPKFRLGLYPNGTATSPHDVVIKLHLISDDLKKKESIRYVCAIIVNEESVEYAHYGLVTLTSDTGGNVGPDIRLILREELKKKKDVLIKNAVGKKDVLCVAFAAEFDYKIESKVCTNLFSKL